MQWILFESIWSLCEEVLDMSSLSLMTLLRQTSVSNDERKIQRFDRGVLVRLTDSARNRFFDKNGDPKEIRVIKNETSRMYQGWRRRVRVRHFERDADVRLRSSSTYLSCISTKRHTHTYIHTTATPRKQWFVWQTYHIGSSLNKIWTRNTDWRPRRERRKPRSRWNVPEQSCSMIRVAQSKDQGHQHAEHPS